MDNQTDLMAIIRAMQQSIEKLQAAIENPPPQSGPHRPPGTSKTPEQTSHIRHVTQTTEESDDERQNPRSRRQENYYEAHSTRNTYANTGVGSTASTATSLFSELDLLRRTTTAALQGARLSELDLRCPDKIMSSNEITSSPVASSPVQTPRATLEDQTSEPSTPNASMGVSASEPVDLDSGPDDLNNENLKSSKLLAGIMGKANAKPELGNYSFDQDFARRELGTMIILHEYPLSIVDHVGFRRYSSALQPLFKIPTRNSVKSDIINIYEHEREQVMKLLEGIISRVAVTTDLWTSGNQKKGFIAVTGHFIYEEFILQSRILRSRTRMVPAPSPRSISCWAQLAESFRSNFLTSRVQRKNSLALFRIIQGPKESLKSYYARFNSEKLLIDHLDPGVTFATMARGVD
ncbi:hypothetical protein RJ639_007063 [Escallonia herrerae]|uniref:Retrotransposon gag domain-containing protein n=1 Tax=Escallonia herrerae TaxID=1293975 RepID=A0AA88VVT9_9ASTE|nr:hypothetical protein RJ639_007063 [Escallonia herrerae]